MKRITKEYIDNIINISENKTKTYLKYTIEKEIAKQIREYNLMNPDEIRILVFEEVKIQKAKK